MVKRIINWFKKLGLTIEFAPALTFFGVLTVSVGKIAWNPDKWGEGEKKRLLTF